MITMSKELMSTMTPDEVTEYIKSRMEKEGLDTSNVEKIKDGIFETEEVDERIHITDIISFLASNFSDTDVEWGNLNIAGNEYTLIAIKDDAINWNKEK